MVKPSAPIDPAVIRRYDIVYGKIIKILNKEAVILVSGDDKGKAIVPVATEARLKLPIPNKTMYSHIVTLGDIFYIARCLQVFFYGFLNLNMAFLPNRGA